MLQVPLAKCSPARLLRADTTCSGAAAGQLQLQQRCAQLAQAGAHPTGRIMNSCMARALPAWLPPLMMLKEGTGSTCASGGVQSGQQPGAQLRTAHQAAAPRGGARQRRPRAAPGSTLQRQRAAAAAGSGAPCARQRGPPRTSFLLPARSAMCLYRGTFFSAAPACGAARAVSTGAAALAAASLAAARHGACHATPPAPAGGALCFGSCHLVPHLGDGHGDGQDGVGAQLALVGGAVQLNHELVQLLLLGGVLALRRVRGPAAGERWRRWRHGPRAAAGANGAP
jgi:hypothetical protein